MKASNVWITKTGLRVGQEQPGATKATGICPECNVAFNGHHECSCGAHGGEELSANGPRGEEDREIDTEPGIHRMEASRQASDPTDAILRRLEGLIRGRERIPVASQARQPNSQRFSWVAPLMAIVFGYGKRFAKPIPKLAVWVAQLTTIFWLVVQVLPENPLAGLEWANELAEGGFPFNYAAASAVTALFLVWSLIVVRSGPSPAGGGTHRE